MLSIAKVFFLHAHTEFDGRLTNDHLSKSSPFCKFHRIREAIIEESKVFHRKKSSIYEKKRSFRDKLSRIARNGFRITAIRAIFASNV